MVVAVAEGVEGGKLGCRGSVLRFIPHLETQDAVPCCTAAWELQARENRQLPWRKETEIYTDQRRSLFQIIASSG